MHPFYIVLIIIGAALAIFFVVKLAQAAAERERQRVAAIIDWSIGNGFSFQKKDLYDLDRRFEGVLEIGRGHDRYAYDVLARDEPSPAFIFQYHFKTWETRTVTDTDSKGRTHTRTETYEQTHHRRYLILELGVGATFPALAIRRENWLDKVAGFIGFDDVDFESEAFSSRYHIKSKDRQFAYAIIHPRMMEWMLTTEVTLQLDGRLLLMDLSGRAHTAVNCYAVWAVAVGFVNRIPPFVWQDWGHAAELHLPEAVPPADAGSPASGGISEAKTYHARTNSESMKVEGD